MFKRTKGYILLTLLVVTGLASQVTNDTLNSKERRFLVNHLKESKKNFSKNIKGLSQEQLTFKPSADKWSIQECIQHLALVEDALWSMVDATVKAPANPDKRSSIKLNDQELIDRITDRSKKLQAPEMVSPGRARWETTEEALTALKERRSQIIEFAKTTTDDLRNHVVALPGGVMEDSYQALLHISAHMIRHTRQIEEIQSTPGFPRR